MRRIALVITVLLVGLVAVVAFTRSPDVHEAALLPISVTATVPGLAEQSADQGPPADAIPAEEPAQTADAVTVRDDASTANTPAHDDAQGKSCKDELKALGVKFEVLEPISEENGCGAERPLKVSALGIELKPAVTTQCEVARALAVWTRDVLVPSARLHLKATPNAISTGDSYQCRSRRGGGEVKISEHAHANAVDISGIAFSDHETVTVMDRTASADAARDFQAAIRGGACAYFTTVLGPGANGAHADHLHFDLIQRRNGYRICG